MFKERTAEAAYIHIPFCVRKCHYCDFVSFPGADQATLATYHRALVREMIAAGVWASRQGEPGGVRRLQTVFLGGGTPTVQDPERLAELLDVLNQTFGLAADGEFTLEANPGTVTEQGLVTLRHGGFNRISFGLQAAQPALLRRLGRIHGPDDFVSGVRMAEQAGFRAINADLMFGLPDQTLEDVAATLELILGLPISHVSFYSLSLEDGTPLKSWCDANPGHLPDEGLERAQYDLIRRTLARAGFEHYEISNAARPGHRCRHNLTYWTGQPYYGFGVAAHSYLQGVRRGNTTSLQDYLDQYSPSAPSHEFPMGSVEEVVDEAEAGKEMLMLGLRLIDGVRFADYAARFGCDLREHFAEPVNRLIGRGLLHMDETGIRLTETGIHLANQVFCEFV